jgi:hypothetical protein
MTEALRTSETSVYHETKTRYIPEGCNLQIPYLTALKKRYISFNPRSFNVWQSYKTKGCKQTCSMQLHIKSLCFTTIHNRGTMYAGDVNRGTDIVSLLPLETTAATATAEQTVDWRRDGRRPDDVVYIAMHTVRPASSVWAALIQLYQTNHFSSVLRSLRPAFEVHRGTGSFSWIWVTLTL